MRGQGYPPGSHAPGFELPSHEDWQLPPWDERVPVRAVEGQAGDCVICTALPPCLRSRNAEAELKVPAWVCAVTEKLSHSTVPWAGKGERRTAFYKFVPYVRRPRPLCPLSFAA